MALDPIPHTSDVLSTDKLKAGKISDTWHRFLRSWESKFDSLSKVLARLKFTDLTDVPSSYTGQAGKSVKVNVGEDGLEFYTPSAGVTVHNNLTGIQGGAVGEHYHHDLADHTESVAFLNGGSATHTQLDNERTSSIDHRADALIHFEQADIDHTAINTGGSVYTHPQIDIKLDEFDVHVADDEIHNLDYDKREWIITNGLITGVVYKKGGSTVDTMTITYDSSDRPLQYSYTSGKVVDLVHLGTGFLQEAV